jgi:hypothetical protein
MPPQSTSFTMRGQTAELRVGYEIAACLGRWEMTRNGRGFHLSAPVIHQNLYWLTAGYPLDLCVMVGRSSWRWRNVTVSGDNPVAVFGTGKPEVLYGD